MVFAFFFIPLSSTIWMFGTSINFIMIAFHVISRYLYYLVLLHNYTLTQNWPYIEITGKKPTNPVKYPTIIACQRNVSIDKNWLP